MQCASREHPENQQQPQVFSLCVSWQVPGIIAPTTIQTTAVSAAREGVSAMFDGFEEVRATWWRATCVWWLIVWRASVIILVLGAVVGAALYYAITVRGVQFDIPRLVVEGVLYSCILVPLVLLIVVRMALRKNYENFRIVLFIQCHASGRIKSQVGRQGNSL